MNDHERIDALMDHVRVIRDLTDSLLRELNNEHIYLMEKERENDN
jgi:hypothetical protein